MGPAVVVPAGRYAGCTCGVSVMKVLYEEQVFLSESAVHDCVYNFYLRVWVVPLLLAGVNTGCGVDLPRGRVLRNGVMNRLIMNRLW